MLSGLKESQVWSYLPIPSTVGWGQEECYKFEASLVYIPDSQLVWATQRDPMSKITMEKNKSESVERVR